MPKGPQSAKSGLGTGIVSALAKQLHGIIKVVDTNPGTLISIVHSHVAALNSEPPAVLGARAI
jgi:two-component sensor histidine kinase